ncbi:MAG: protein kinase domain-containing protein [Panacagrimonas sp.]
MKPLPCPAPLWPRFSALLDVALDVATPERAAWLDTLGAEHADLKPWLSALFEAGARTSMRPPLDRAVSAVASTEFSAGQRLGPWVLERPLGSGGMGSVWLAQRADGAYEREVALKLPHAHLIGGALQARFARERNILAGLAHPQIARFYDAGLAEGGQPWLALEFVDGVPITSYCQTQHLDVRARIELIRQVASAVQAAHARLIVHRDLKPANVLVTAAGQVKLLDFGIAKLLDDDAEGSGLTLAGGHAATPDYAAPEQLSGGVITVATDVYALGVMLYELLSGSRPWSHRSRLGKMIGTDIEAPLASAKAAGERRRELSGDLDAILAKAIAPEPLRRYVSMEAFADDLGRYLDHLPIKARRISRWSQASKFVRRHRQAVGFSALLTVALVAGIAGVLWQAQRTEEQARRALAIRDFLFEVVFKPSDASIAGDRPRAEISARDLLDVGVARIPQHFAHDLQTQADLLNQAGRVYLYQLDNERALDVFGQRMALLSGQKGPLDAEVIEDELVLFWLALQRYDAVAMAQHLATSDRHLRMAGLDRHLLRAEWWLARSDLVARDGSPPEARRHALEQALALYERYAPKDSGHVATLSNLGYLELEARQPQSALRYFDQAVHVHGQSPQKIAPDLGRLHARRARAFHMMERAGEALAALTLSRSIFRNSVGLDSPLANEAKQIAGVLQERWLP